MSHSNLLKGLFLAILYSFRRCPYAIRARFTLHFLKQVVELREVVLKDKPEALLLLGGRSTVPQLIDEKRLDEEQIEKKRYAESLDIIFWAIESAKKQPSSGLNMLADQLWPASTQTQSEICAWIDENDHVFKGWLDKYKYADRHLESPIFYREQGEVFLQKIEDVLGTRDFICGNELSLADVAVFPFIRQFAGVDSAWFEKSKYAAVIQWLDGMLNHQSFVASMRKYPQWKNGNTPIFFPN